MRTYLELSKARLCTMVLVTTLVGYLMAVPGTIAIGHLLATLTGTMLTALGANALNQYIERRPDALMERTRRRPLPSGRISPARALSWGIASSAIGAAILAVGSGLWPAALAVLTVLLYVGAYTPLKRISTVNTALGAVCGAIPPMIGWSAAAGGLGLGAWLLFALLFLWQMPHFFALAWMYREDYARGGYKMLPVVDPQGRLTFPVTALFALLLLPLGLSVTASGLAGPWFAVGSLVLGGWWVALSFRLARSRSDRDARRVFLASLAYLPLALVLMVADRGPAAPGAGTWQPGQQALAEVAEVEPAAADTTAPGGAADVSDPVTRLGHLDRQR